MILSGQIYKTVVIIYLNMTDQPLYVSRKPPSSIEIDLSKVVKKSPRTVEIKHPEKVFNMDKGDK